jgi:hypothetical protein
MLDLTAYGYCGNDGDDTMAPVIGNVAGAIE